MAAFPVERFEAEGERFLRARVGREWLFRTGAAPGRSLKRLYLEDFPSLTSRDLYDDLLGAALETERQKGDLQALLALAILEHRALEPSARLAQFEAESTLPSAELQEIIGWRQAQRRWANTPDVATRHRLYETWLGVAGAELTPLVQRYLEALVSTLDELAPAVGWSTYWSERQGWSSEGGIQLANKLLELHQEQYAGILAVYLSQRGLPAGDAWEADADWAFREPRFDAAFPARGVMAAAVRVHRDLGIELDGQTGLSLELAESSSGLVGGYVAPVSVPHEVHVAVGLVGGCADVQATLRALGEAQHALHTDPSLPLHERRLGDPTTTRAYGLLLEGLTRERSWLQERTSLGEGLADFLVIATLAWMRRVRAAAATAEHHRRVWADPFAGGLSADYAERMSATTGLRHFAEPSLLPLRHATVQPLEALVEVRAEVLAAQLRAYLRTEYDEHWWRNPRAGRFLVQELWRPGRRFSAEQLLEFMGYQGSDVRLLGDEMIGALATV